MRWTSLAAAAVLVVGCGFDAPKKDEKKAQVAEGKPKIEAQKKAALKEEEPKTRKLRTRDELKTLLADRSMEQVKDLLGKPDSTDEVGISRTWSYSAPLSFDPVTEKTDSRVVVWFRDGSVDRLTFTPGR